MGQRGVDRTVGLEVAANEVNVIYRQRSHLPYLGDLLFEELAQATQSFLGDPLLDPADREMWGIWAGLGLKVDCLVQLLA